MLSIELSKPEYDGLSAQDCLTLLLSKSELVVGRISGAAIKDLQLFISTTGLRKRLATANLEGGMKATIAGAIEEAIHPAYLAAESTFSINISDPAIASVLQGAVATGIMTQAEADSLVQIATRPVYTFSGTSLADIVSVRSPLLMADGNYLVAEHKTGAMLALTVNTDLPASDNVLVEVSESHNGIVWSQWGRLLHIHNVYAASVYYQPLPYSALQRKFRCCGVVYKVDGNLEVV